jgi:hypothetical protein
MQLDRMIAGYRRAAIACHQGAEDRAAAVERELARANYEAALARYDDYVTCGIVPVDLAEEVRVMAAG